MWEIQGKKVNNDDDQDDEYNIDINIINENYNIITSLNFG